MSGLGLISIHEVNKHLLDLSGGLASEHLSLGEEGEGRIRESQVEERETWSKQGITVLLERVYVLRIQLERSILCLLNEEEGENKVALFARWRWSSATFVE